MGHNGAVSEAELRALLSSREALMDGGMRLDDLSSELQVDKEELREIMKSLVLKDAVVALPDNKAGRWYMKYYIPPPEDSSVADRLEPILTELGIPPWIDVQIFRGWKVIFVGEYGKKPGLRIIDYGKNPPLMFRDTHAGGAVDEVLKFARLSKYKCEKYRKTFWYGFHGKPYA